ncbi:MAG TPA: T9SS type A sorting domain-containing protein [Saprospiraceae bacterium]|nr:T9SS type A sorting domain-containing protein [Saprospiraceae bacterium]
MKKFTNSLAGLATLLLMFSYALNGYSQYVLTINEPAEIAGDYPVARAQFGDQSGANVTADLALGYDDQAIDSNGDMTPGTVTDGCEPITNGGDLDGKFAILDRGECNFTVKADNLAATAAIGLMVCNNSDSDPSIMSGTSAFTGVAFMMSRANCNIIKMALENGNVNGTFRYQCDPMYDDNVFWGNEKGQGDFDGGLGDWTSVGVSVENTDLISVDDLAWKFTADGTSDCTYFGSGSVIGSESLCNGAVYFDYCGTTLSVYAPAEIPNPYPRYTAELISPVIDCSNRENIVLSYTTLDNRLNGSSSVAFSTDGGATWGTAISIPTANVTNQVLNTEQIDVPASVLDNQSNCRIKFIGTGDFYYWIIDDVVLKEELQQDVALSDDWYAGASDKLFPEGQGALPIPFMVDVKTLGNASPGNVSVNVEVVNSANETLYSENLDYGVLQADTTYENAVFPNKYTPATENDTYTIKYTANAEADGDLGNNVLETSYTIGGKIFSKTPVDGSGNIGGWRYNSMSNYATIANNYHFTNGTAPGNYKYKVDNVQFGYAVQGDANHSGTVSVTIYQWVDVNDDGVVGVDNDERFPLGGGFAIVDPDSADRVITVPVYKLDSEEALVLEDFEDGQEYNLLVAVNFNPIDPGTTGTGGEALWYFYAANSNSNGDINPAANVFALATFADDPINLAGCVFGSGSSGDEADRVLDQSGALVWHIPVELDIVTSSNDLDPNISFEVFPNPTTDYVNVDLSFENIEDQVTILVNDITGKNVITKQYYKVSDKNVRLDVSNLASGVYSVLVSTNSGFNSTKLTIQK